MIRSALFGCGATILAAGAAAATAGAPNLDGLWVAQRQYGPVIGGPLLLVPRGSALTADIAGFSVPVRRQGNRLAFTLADGKGDFRGYRRGDRIDGQWIGHRMDGAGARFSTPITLIGDGRGGWRGEVAPFDDRMRYFMPLKRIADGKWTSFLRNPERNQGLFLGVSRLELDGENVSLVGTRRGAKTEKVVSNGRWEQGDNLITVQLPGGNFDFTPDRDERSAFYPRARSGEKYQYSAPVRLDDGWPVSSLDKEGLNRAAIERLIQFLIDIPMDGVSAHQVHSILIARHGKLVLEEYFHGAHRDEPHDLRSASKSWIAMLIGAAMLAGVPIRLDTPVYRTMLGSVPADLDPRKKAMTLEHLIGMTAGFDCDDSGDRPGDEDVFQNQDKEPDWYRYMLNVPMAWNSGEKIVYCSGKPNLAAGMLEKIARDPMPELFDRLIGRPLKMKNYHLYLQPTGEAYGGGGHRFTSRDFLKWAQLMANHGKWEGKQIFSRDWARQSGAALRLLSPKSGQTYGFGWNSVAYDYKGRKLHAFFAGGNGGQISMAIPELDLVIVMTGGNYADPVLFTGQRVYVPKYILPAVN